MSDKEVKEFIDKINAGLKLAEKRMLQEKSQRNETIVVYTEGKGIQHISARQLLADNNFV